MNVNKGGRAGRYVAGKFSKEQVLAGGPLLLRAKPQASQAASPGLVGLRAGWPGQPQGGFTHRSSGLQTAGLARRTGIGVGEARPGKSLIANAPCGATY